MDRPRDYHTKWNKSERQAQDKYGITYIWNLKYDTNELIYKTEIDLTEIENKHSYERERGGRDELRVWN